MSYIELGEDWTKKVDFLSLFIINSFPSHERPHGVNHLEGRRGKGGRREGVEVRVEGGVGVEEERG